MNAPRGRPQRVKIPEDTKHKAGIPDRAAKQGRLRRRVAAPLPLGPGRYKRPPSAEEIQAIRKTIVESQSPETYYALTWDSVPSPDIEHELYLPIIELDRAKRPDGQMVPCPFCSGRNPKCLGFYLLWSADGHLRVVGRKCGPTYFGETFARLTEEAKAKQQAEQNLNFLLTNLSKLPKWQVELAELAGDAERLEQLETEFRNAVPDLHRLLSGFSKTGGNALTVEQRLPDSSKAARLSAGAADEYETVRVGTLFGGAFLRAEGHAKRARSALASLEAIRKCHGQELSDDDVLEICPDTDAEIARAVETIKTALEDAKSVVSHIENAKKFLSEESLESLHALSSHELCSPRFFIERQGSAVRIRVRGAAGTFRFQIPVTFGPFPLITAGVATPEN